MVNVIRENRKIILDMLRQSDGPVSGVRLAEEAGISRVAVWKNIQALIESGYGITVARSGYTIAANSSETDIMSELELKSPPGEVHIYRETDSTMNAARKLAADGASGMTTAVAARQYAGIGTRGRSWESPEGGLYFTVIQRPGIGLQYHNLTTLAASASVSLYLENRGIKSWCLWPNDVYTEKGKIAGILTEVCGNPDLIKYTLTGVGININNEMPSGASIKQITGRKCSRVEALDELLVIFKDISGREPAEIVSLWKSRAVLKNRITVRKRDTIVSGRISSVSPEGNLVIDAGPGKRFTVFPGDEIIKKERDL